MSCISIYITGRKYLIIITLKKKKNPGIFGRGGEGGGGPGQSDKKSSDNVFFLSAQLILQKSNGKFQRKLSFFKVPEGGPTFSRGCPIAYFL